MIRCKSGHCLQLILNAPPLPPSPPSAPFPPLPPSPAEHTLVPDPPSPPRPPLPPFPPSPPFKLAMSEPLIFITVRYSDKLIASLPRSPEEAFLPGAPFRQGEDWVTPFSPCLPEAPFIP